MSRELVSTLRLPKVLRWLQPINFPHKLGAMERVFGRSLSRKGIVWVHTAAGLTWKLDLAHAPARWIVYGKYEGPAFLDWARAFLSPSSIIVDSGANIGQMLLYLAQWVPEGKVLAFEPGRHQVAWLMECLERNPHLPVEVRAVGLGDSNRAAHLRECGPCYVHGARNEVSETEGEPIQLVRLADVLTARQIDRVDLWKLDVEGSELAALMGAEDLLRGKKIRALYVELSRANGERIREFLAGLGYKCFLFKDDGALMSPDALPEHTNGLFLPDGVSE